MKPSLCACVRVCACSRADLHEQRVSETGAIANGVRGGDGKQASAIPFNVKTPETTGGRPTARPDASECGEDKLDVLQRDFSYGCCLRADQHTSVSPSERELWQKRCPTLFI